jgi:preprotein translocase subunit SecG
MESVILVIHVLAAIALVALILLQQGKGADMGAAFGSGASATVFGSRGSGSFITRATAILAATFFITSLALAYYSGLANPQRSGQGVESVLDRVPAASDLPSLPSAAPQDQSRDLPVAPSVTNE